MKAINDDDEKKEAVKQQFKRFREAGISGDKLAGIYQAAHKAIRADPNKKRDPLDLGYFKKRSTPKDPKAAVPKKRWGLARRSVQQRHATIKQKLTAKGIKKAADV